MGWSIGRLPKGLLPRSPRAFRRDHRESADAAPDTRLRQGPSAVPDALRGHPLHTGAAGTPQAQDEQVKASGLFMFSAILITDPVEGEDPEDNAVTQLLIVIADPDSGEWHGGSKCLYALEVPDDVAEQYGEELRIGDSVIVAGRLNSGRCFTATEIHPRPLPGNETGR